MTIQEQIADAVEFALIEQLGGYNAAILKRHVNYLNDIVDTDLIDALLNYRRAHNIYEVGDKVVYMGLDGSYYGTLDTISGFVKDYKGVDQVILTHSDGSSFAYYFINFRHANDAEIEAGHRL